MVTKPFYVSGCTGERRMSDYLQTHWDTILEDEEETKRLLMPVILAFADELIRRIETDNSGKPVPLKPMSEPEYLIDD